MAKVLATPGVYIEEKSAFSSSVVPVSTAVPAFIGYTQRATRGNKPLTNVPTRVTSLAEFEEMFGGAPKTKFTIEAEANVGYTLSADQATRYLLHSCLRHFYSNGGGDCYVVSIGNYGNEITQGQLTKVLFIDYMASYMLKHNLFIDCGFTYRNCRSAINDYNAENLFLNLGIRVNMARREYDR